MYETLALIFGVRVKTASLHPNHQIICTLTPNIIGYNSVIWQVLIVPFWRNK